MRRIALLAPLLLLLGGCALFVERPDYQVVERHEDFELRRYPPYVVAETVVEGAFEKAGNRAFGTLAGYIGGDNREREKIDMTAPVNQAPADGEGREIDMTAPVVQQPSQETEGRWVIAFIMPKQYDTVAELPEPTNPKVRLRRVGERLMAALQYSGTWSRERYAKRERRLLEAVRAADLEPVAAPIWARYNPPLTPWFLRRNEVLVEVRRPGDG